MKHYEIITGQTTAHLTIFKKIKRIIVLGAIVSIISILLMAGAAYACRVFNIGTWLIGVGMLAGLVIGLFFVYLSLKKSWGDEE